MAKYQSTLTGPQMDAALAAMPDAEAYARGTRNGQEVQEGDPTYHNNAKYFATDASQKVAQIGTAVEQAAASATSAEQSKNTAQSSATSAHGDAERAEAAADRAESIADAEFVSYAIAQNLTAAQKQTAKANIAVPTATSELNNDAGFQDYDGAYSIATSVAAGKADKSSISAGTAGTSSATSGATLAVPYLTMTDQGVVSAYGTHTHTISGLAASAVSSGTFAAARVAGITYVTSAPTSANTDGIKIAVLSSEPTTKYNGWLYIITG